MTSPDANGLQLRILGNKENLKTTWGHRHHICNASTQKAYRFCLTLFNFLIFLKLFCTYYSVC